jgi:predicted metal-dependent hydrolase
VQQLLLFNPGSTETPSETAAGIVYSEASPWERPVDPPRLPDNPRGLPDGAVPSSTSPASPSQSAPSGRDDRSTAVLFVRHPRARRYLIRVRTDGSVRVTIPRRGSKREAAAFYEQQREWIARQQERVAQVRQTLPGDLPEAEQREYRMRARRELPARLFELAAIAGVSVRRVSVRNQRQRWGSCSASGLICLNWRLITMPGWVRDYVLYHELMHLKRMDHSPAFWKLVAQVCPRFRDARRWLRRHALAPHTPEAHAEA